ncbi:MAG: MinD/ParA family protein [Oligoflexia bacterium]|nr:MinD/ParA family protein [Oligoflexia bacterium]
MLELESQKNQSIGATWRVGNGSVFSPKVVSITSGKGGVGKSGIVANLAITFAKKGKRVLLLDGDFGLANLDIIFDLKAKRTVHDLLQGCDIQDVVSNVAPGVDVIASSSGIFKMTNLNINDKAILIDSLKDLESRYDVLLMDTGAGIGEDVIWLNSTANEVVVVATPEPTSIADAYALIKVLHQRHKIKDFKLLVNQIKTEAEGLRVFNNISAVSDKFLNVNIDYLGYVFWDDLWSKSVRNRKPLISLFPDSKAAKDFDKIADTIFKSTERRYPRGNIQFFWKAILGHA